MPLSTGHTKQPHPSDQFSELPRRGSFFFSGTAKMMLLSSENADMGWDKKDIESSKKI